MQSFAHCKTGKPVGSVLFKTFRVIPCVLVLLMLLGIDANARLFGQRITLSLQQVSMPKVFKSIEAQTPYRFLYVSDLIDKNKLVNIDVHDRELEDVLAILFDHTPITYALDGYIVVLRNKYAPKKPDTKVNSLLPPSPVEFFNRYNEPDEIKGIVVSDKGEPIPGATVLIKGSKRATSTKADGTFTFVGENARNATLSVSCIGFIGKDVNMEGNRTVVITLKGTSNMLDEMVVKGYYVTTNRMNTGNVSTVKGEDIAKQPVMDPLSAMQGRVAGLEIDKVNGPYSGALMTVYIRGRNSIASRLEPLYLIDGVPFPVTTTAIGTGAAAINPLNNISMSDIESIEVLKDADATAIYGSRGANGVILITTKKGKGGALRLNVEVNTGGTSPARYAKLLNTQQYLAMRHEAFNNDGKTPGIKDYDINGVWDTTRYTDWQKMLIGNTVHHTDAHASLSGGSAGTQFIVNASYSKDGTPLPGDFPNSKGAVSMNLSHFSTDQRFRMSIGASYMNNLIILPQNDPSYLILLPPDAPAVYDKSENLNWQNSTFINPFARILATSKTVTDNLLSNASLSYRILPGLEAKAGLGYTYIQSTQSNITPLQSLPPSAGTDPTLRVTDYGSRITKTWLIEPQLRYFKKIGNHSVDVLGGLTFQQTSTADNLASGYGYVSDALLGTLSGASVISGVAQLSTLYRYNAVFTRIGYNYKEKYLLNLTARRDGSSRFGPGRQFGNFGAIGGAWIFSNEKFFGNKKAAFSFGKLRLSYGTTGNDGISDYKYLSRYTSLTISYQGVKGLYPTSLFNPDYSWEVNKKFEVGTELGFVKDRILFSASYFSNRSGNQLIGYNLPNFTGFGSVAGNFPAVIQNFGWEFTLNTNNIRNKKVTWTTSLNLTSAGSKLVSFPDLAKSSYASSYIIGKSIQIAKRYHATGVDPLTGVFTFLDVNKDGAISKPADNTTIMERRRQYYGGISNALTYKGFQLDVLLQFVKQTAPTYINSFGAPGMLFPDGTANQPQYVLSRWQKPGDITSIQAFTQSAASAAYKAYINAQASDYVYGDASYIRLKNVSLIYKFPDSWMQHIHIQNLQLYVQAQNLLTITKYRGVDPETQSYFPVLKTITAGIKLTL
ncbi:SusC/RagA family TonB-linked outer membrane protein [Deminuibacter soli]|uniref:SusC/RagA family TonB-linked outer membrane protein n=1 Tax=Deminuibacter soli TaxID=2291815 RepID=A0A3E1NIS1_9BACT|nr:SusC/RagA family TonB-linked outer membrane protein [Deminuibacter soli]RFM27835.1 SusC/RagA family TonB-linked outer membrane protein [Deminuibacter soli]